MNATFYVCSAPTRKIDKRDFLTTLKTLNNLKPFEPFDAEEGQLILKYDEQLMSCNYVKIDDWYYFVKEPITRIGQQIVMTLTKDPLMSNMEDLLNMDVIIDRSSNEFNSYVYDNRQIGQVNYTTFSKDIGGWSYGQGYNIMVVIGGGQ